MLWPDSVDIKIESTTIHPAGRFCGKDGRNSFQWLSDTIPQNPNIKKGDVIKCPKDTEHWHSSTKESDVTYLALYGGEQPTMWTEVLTQEYYDQVAEKIKSN